MRKLLSILGTITISSSAFSALGFQYANKAQSSIIRRISNYVDVSSLLARATILSQNSNPTTGGRGFSLDYASRYIDNRQIGDFFPREASLRGAAKTTQSRVLLGSMFDYPDNNSQAFIPQLKDSNLDLNPDSKVGKTGNSELVNTFSTLSGVLQILLGNDFNSGLASTIYGLLNSAALDNIGFSIKDSIPSISTDYLRNPATGEWIFTQLGNIWSEDDLLAAYPGRDFTSLTFAEVFKVRQDNFWMGISRILYSGYGANWTSSDAEIKAASTPVEKANKAIPTEGKDINLVLNGILIEGIIHLVKYFRTLGVYYERIMSQALKPQLILERNHVFDKSETNSVWLGQKINQVYAPSTNIVLNNATEKQKISMWSEENINGTKKYYQLINIQSLIQFFTKLFVVDTKTDPQSLATQQALAVILGVPTLSDEDKDKAPSIDNPFGDVVLAPLVQAIGDYFGQRIDIDILGSIVHLEGLGGFLSQFLGFLRAILANSTPMWDTSPLTNDAQISVSILTLIEIESSKGPYSFYSYFASIISQIKTILDEIGQLFPDNIKELLNIVIEAGETFLSKIDQEKAAGIPLDKQNFGNPFRGLMSGELLPEIYNLIESTGLIQIPSAVRQFFPNLNTTLTTKLGEILEAFGIAGEDWPIYLYGLKDKSLSEIVLTVGNRFETDRYKSLEETQKYLFNSRALERILKPLANNEVKIEFNGDVPEALASLFDDKNQTNLVVAILIAIGYREQIKSVTIDNLTTQNSFVSFMLGIQGNDTEGYRQGSFFYGLEQLYGHQNNEEPPALLLASKDTLQKIISELNALINWMRDVSIPQYVDTFFTPYFLNGWKTKYLSSKSVSEPSETAFIEYELTYTQKKQAPLVYRVRLERDSWKPNNSSEPWFNYGTWKLYSINRIM